MGDQPAVADKFLSFLPHSVGIAGSVQPAGPPTTNPGFLTPTGAQRTDPLQDIVNRRVLEDKVAKPKHPNLRNLRFGLVDLTGPGKLANPEFAGHDETRQGGLGSMAKTASMCAAFQLKFDLAQLASQKGLTSEKALFDAARDIWNDTQKRDDTNVQSLFPAKPKIELLGKLIEIDGKRIVVPRPFSAPDLERMFKFGADGSLNFIGSDQILVDDPSTGTAPHTSQRVEDYVNGGGEKIKIVREFSFAERMMLMVDESDNSATHTCLESISFLYLASMLWQTDLYRPERGGGLWEGSTHDGAFRWILPPVPGAVRGSDFVSATAASVSALLTLIEQASIVDLDSCNAMLHLMSKNKVGLKRRIRGKLVNVGSYTRSFFQEGLADAGIIPDRLHSKLGIGDFVNDCVIIERDVGPDPNDPDTNASIRYVATGFDDPGDGGDLGKLIVELDKCIRENNGFLTDKDP